MPQSPEVRIYLADRRNVLHTENSQKRFTLTAKADDGACSFESLDVFCEITQKPGTMEHHTCSATGALFILPLVGKVAVKDLMDDVTVDAGQLLQVSIVKDQQLELENPYQSEWISYLLWEIKTEQRTSTVISDFDMEGAPGALVSIPGKGNSFVPLTVQVGMFDGRQEDLLTAPTSEHKFIFVIEGAFEVQKRLLHARDGLSLPDCESLEFEALSNKAIILILSMGENLREERNIT